ncbi:CotH kinase family protein [Microbacteriaceae bacterium VKM Ac-2855]|nr:CotH kinase family protein [Microbacteriaceae bacterium VKM Ac-2855]
MAASLAVVLSLGLIVSPAAAADASPRIAPGPAQVSVAPILINEVSEANWSNTTDEDGDAKDWVELYNPSTKPQDLSYWGLSNKDTTAFRWALPTGTTIAANGYLTVWLSKKDRAVAGKELHANFNIDNGVDKLLLSAPDGTASGHLVDSVAPPRTKTDTSWCRTPNGAATSAFAFCGKPTRGAANSGPTSEAMLAAPALSTAGGLYASPQTVAMTAPEGSQIRYTIDGSEPSITSTLYTAPVLVAKSESLRAASFRPTAAAATVSVDSSFVTTESYVIDPNVSTAYAGQRTIFVTLKPADLALYKAKNESRDFASVVDLREKDGSTIIKTDADSSVAGQLGSLQGQKAGPLDITLRDSRGSSEFTYKLFESEGPVTLDRFRLRNGGSDWPSAHLRDQFAQSLVSADQVASNATPVALFVNGQYNGVLDLREREDETLVASSTGTAKEAVDFISENQVKNGGPDGKKSWDDFKNFVTTNSMAVPANYSQAASMADLDSIAQVTALYGWSAIGDWPFRNTHEFRSDATDGLWRFRPHDFDISMDSPDRYWGYNTKSNVNMYTSALYEGGNSIWVSLMKNPDFRNRYLNTVADQLNATLSPTTTNARLDQLVAELQPYMATFRAWDPIGGTADEWMTKDIARLRAFLDTRNANVDAQTQAYFKLSARQDVTVTLNDPAMGAVSINSLDLGPQLSAPGSTWTGGYYPEAAVTLTASPKPGYRFVGWQGSSTATTAAITLTPTSAQSVTAVFEPAPATAAPVFASISSQSNVTGDVVVTDVRATDPAALPLTYSAKGLPKGLDIDAETGRIYGTLTTPGEYSAKITATNGPAKATVPVAWTVADRPGTGVASAPLTGMVNTEWFVTRDLAGSPLVTDQTPIGLNEPNSPRPGLGTRNWSVRWGTVITPTESGTFTFHTDSTTSDGVRVWVGDSLVIDDWTGSKLVNDATVDLTAGTAVKLRVEFFDAGGDAKLSLAWKTPSSSTLTRLPADVMTNGVTSPGSATGISADWFKTRDLSGAALMTAASAVLVDAPSAPQPGFPTGKWSVRFTGTVLPSTSGTFVFHSDTSAADGVRVWVGDTLVIDDWAGTKRVNEGTIPLTGGTAIPFRVEFFDAAYEAKLAVGWKSSDALSFSALENVG